MPLSEQEQRVLRQIERQFQHEHWLARLLRPPQDSRQAARNGKQAAAGFVVGLIALSLSFATSWVVGLVGFIIMLAAGVALVQSVRRLAQDGLSRLQSDRHPTEGSQTLDGSPPRRVGGFGSKWWADRGGDGPRPDDEGFGPD